jgi:hypothetical protein
MGRASGRKKGRNGGAGREERKRLGAHYTPMSMCEEIVQKALYPHLLWMTQDPEGWDRAHPPAAPPSPRRPNRQVPGCFCDLAFRRLRRDCRVHGIEAEQTSNANARARAAEETRELGSGGAVLLAALELAVPMWIDQLRSWTENDRIAMAHSLATTVASKGDILQFGSKRKGEQAEVFNATAKGLAALAFAPGGVTFCGVHWEAQRAA